MQSKPVRNVLRALGPRVAANSYRPAPKFSGTYTVTQAPNDESFEDELTPVRIVCKACRGHIFFTRETPDGRAYARVRCQWCTEGSMSGDQINSYLNNDKIIEALIRRYLEE